MSTMERPPALTIRVEELDGERIVIVQLHPDTPRRPCQTTTHHTEDARVTALVSYEPDCCAPNSVTLFGFEHIIADDNAQRAHAS